MFKWKWVGGVLLRISKAFDMVCSNTRATEENKHELSSGTIYRSQRVSKLINEKIDNHMLTLWIRKPPSTST